jgi:hypothetical protein
MKKDLFSVAFVSLFAIVYMNSCDKDDDENVNNGGIGNTITATIENGDRLNGKIDSVKAVFDYEDENGDWREYIAASAPYVNGGFTLQLQENLDDTYLETISSMFDYADYYVDYPYVTVTDNITISNRNVKTVITIVYACKAGETYSDGRFTFGTSIDAELGWEGRLIYANSDVSVTGSQDETWEYNGKISETVTTKFNMFLKKGWNMMYFKFTMKDTDSDVEHYEHEYTTTTPPGAKWLYNGYNSSSLSSSRIQKIPFLSSKRK